MNARESSRRRSIQRRLIVGTMISAGAIVLATQQASAATTASFRNGVHGLWQEVRTKRAREFEIRTRRFGGASPVTCAVPGRHRASTTLLGAEGTSDVNSRSPRRR